MVIFNSYFDITRGYVQLCHSPAVHCGAAVLPAGWFCPGKTCSWMCPEPLGSWSPCSHRAWVSSLLGGDSPTLFVAPFFGFLTVCASQIAHIFIESYMHYLYQSINIYIYIIHPLVAPSWDLGAPAPGVHGYFFLALVKMTIGPLILSADMLDFIPIISVR